MGRADARPSPAVRFQAASALRMRAHDGAPGSMLYSPARDKLAGARTPLVVDSFDE